MTHIPILRSQRKRFSWFRATGAVMTAVAISSGVYAPQSFAQASLLEKLEAESGPATNKKGQIETDIHPSDVIHWTLAGSHWDKDNGRLVLTVTLRTDQQFTIYQDKLSFEPSDGWKITQQSNPKTERQYDPISRKEVDVYTGGAFDLTLELTGQPESADLKIRYVGCTRVLCLFPHTANLSIPIDAMRLTANPNPSANSESADTPANGNPSDPANAQGTVEEQFASKVKSGQMSFLTLLLMAFAGGLLTNLTPCVAPMIPITIRLLANQSSRPLTSATMYAAGIVATYTTLGVIAALSGALFGNLIAHPAVAISFGVVMFILGLNMLGFGDLSKLQQIGGRIGNAKGGAFNSFLMGAGAGLVASPCTGPILAALLTYTAGRQNTAEAISLLGIYSIGFAIPYVFLGASAARISKVRVSFQVQILTKLVFASVMFGLSLYFLRLPLYGAFTAVKPFWGVIGLAGTIIGAATGAVVILRTAFHRRKAIFLIPTLTFGIGLFFGIQAITRSRGADTKAIVWLHSEQDAFAQSKATGKPIIVDAWAEWCEACKKMDVTTFADPDVVNEISDHWIPLKFDLTESNDANNAIQERYELPGLPTITLLPTGGDLGKKIQISGYTSAPTMLDTLRKHRTTSGHAPGFAP
jgi:thiol:disulfide interchange protein DsbD